MTWRDVVILLIITVSVVVSVHSLRIWRKKGKGCCGSCSGCTKCCDRNEK